LSPESKYVFLLKTVLALPVHDSRLPGQQVPVGTVSVA
jgi:hypothetical protein